LSDETPDLDPEAVQFPLLDMGMSRTWGPTDPFFNSTFQFGNSPGIRGSGMGNGRPESPFFL